MQFFYAPNTISIATAIALEEAGLDYEPLRLDFAAGEQTKAAYHAINPKGRVPALVIDGTVLTETGAILEWIAAQVPEKNLFPTDAIEAAQMRSIIHYLASTMHVNHAHMRRGYRWADNEDSWADMSAKVPQTMTASALFIENECLKGPLVTGNQFTVVDAHLYIISCWLKGDGVDVSPMPRLGTFMATMAARPSVQKLRRNGFLT